MIKKLITINLLSRLLVQFSGCVNMQSSRCQIYHWSSMGAHGISFKIYIKQLIAGGLLVQTGWSKEGNFQNQTQIKAKVWRLRCAAEHLHLRALYAKVLPSIPTQHKRRTDGAAAGGGGCEGTWQKQKMGQVLLIKNTHTNYKHKQPKPPNQRTKSVLKCLNHFFFLPRI